MAARCGGREAGSRRLPGGEEASRRGGGEDGDERRGGAASRCEQESRRAGARYVEEMARHGGGRRMGGPAWSGKEELIEDGSGFIFAVTHTEIAAIVYRRVGSGIHRVCFFNVVPFPPA